VIKRILGADGSFPAKEVAGITEKNLCIHIITVVKRNHCDVVEIRRIGY
jgi:hypothetical protein